MEYLSLYRRYRPRRFSELRGQDHVVAALRNAVLEDRVSHAYLLSGPRGTGKTTAARILAKVLNCANPTDGEPCCGCESCQSIDSGTSFDLHELDAASNNKVDDVRELLSKVALGTPGNTKVYLLDEVHMLTPGAENALLKTLEEPPNHVVFVMATTEPHKVVETIRSRTQHLELNLLSAEQLESLAADVVADAGLDVDAEGISHAVRSGRGSARDTLSALDRVLTGGVRAADTTTVDLLTAIADQDTGRALGTLASGIAQGREPRFLGESLLEALREAFLIAMGVPADQLTDGDQQRARHFADQVTPAVITRSLEALGAALVDMRRSPDPRVDLEVALVRLTGAPVSEPSADGVDALTRRVERLEQAVAEMRGPVGSSTPPPMPPPRARSKDGPAAPARKALAGEDNSAAPLPPPTMVSSPLAPSGEGTGVGGLEPPTESPQDPDQDFPDRDDLTLAWGDEILSMLPKKAKARFTAGRFVAVENGTAIFGLPNEPHLRRCSEMIGEVETALSRRFGIRIPVRLVVDDGRSAQPASPEPASPEPASPVTPDDKVDLGGLVDADPTSGSAVEKLTEAFPGAELVDS